MKRLFNNEESAIIQNLDLLQKGSRLFIQSGMEAAIEPRLQACVSRYARQLGLRRVVRNIRDQVTSTIEQTSDWDHEEAANALEISWGGVSLRASWQGHSRSIAAAPYLSVSTYVETTPLLTSNALDIELCYPPLSKVIGDQKRRERLNAQYNFLPDSQQWERIAGGALRFKPSEAVSMKMINVEMLLNGRASSLKQLCPRLASVFDEYLKICDYFENLQLSEKLKLRAPRRVAKVSEEAASGRWQRSPELDYLRKHSASLLKAAFLYEHGEHESDYDVDWILKESVRGRVNAFLSDAITRKCLNAKLRPAQKPLITDKGRKDDFRSCWALDQQNLTLAIRQRVPASTETASMRLDIRVYVNSITTGRRGFASCKSAWEQSRAAVMFERGDIAWNRKIAKKLGPFWGYDTTLDVDLEALADGDIAAIGCVDEVLEAFVNASLLYKNVRKQAAP